MAFCASSSVLISTKANPRARPVAMSRITFTDSTFPARANSSCRSVSPVSYGRFPTYSLRLITDSSVDATTGAASAAHVSPTVQYGPVGGFRLVAKQNFRRSESGEARYARRQHSTRQDPYRQECYHTCRTAAVQGVAMILGSRLQAL